MFAPKRKMYQYFAELLRIIDADTVKARVDLGMSTFVEVSLRFYGIDAPPMKLAAGQFATVYLHSILPIGSRLLIQSHGLDKYGRWLADVATTPTPQPNDTATNDPTAYTRNICAELVAKKHAIPYATQ